MVFESRLADFINKHLGDYVENLDNSKLEIVLWKGDVVLQDLKLKESALDDLDLPVKIKASHIGKLTLKIPWKNLFKEPAVASIDGLYALVVPNVAIKNNAEKEEKAKQESKQRKLLQIEEAKKAAEEKRNGKEKKDSFAEKLFVHIIKNLQITIHNIHFRYEDAYTNPKHPFSVGVSLAELVFQTTDENWKRGVVREVSNKICKLVKMESLAVYWNSCSEQYATLPDENLFENLKEGIAGENKTVAYQFLIKPISAKAQLELNKDPETNNFSLPKVYLKVVFDEIEVMLSKLQYNDVLALFESFERLYIQSAYRKYRPDVPVHNHARAWWHFALDSILEKKVKPNRGYFSYDYARRLFQMMKKYKNAYKEMLSKPMNVSLEVQKDIEECEKLLELVPITAMRSNAEYEVAKSIAEKLETRKTFLRRFLDFFKWTTEKEDQMTKEEKTKLYEAIGYQENMEDPILPREYVAVMVLSEFSSLLLTLNDETKNDSQILKFQLKDVHSSVRQRPGESALQVQVKIDNLTVLGTPQNDTIPELVLSQKIEEHKEDSLLSFEFDIRPLVRECDTRINIKARPVEIVYDAVSVNNVTEFFRPPKNVYLRLLYKAAIAKFKDISKISASGLRHAIEQHKYTDICIDMKPSYVIIPHGGQYQHGAVSMLVFDLGNLTVRSEKSTVDEEVTVHHFRDYENFKINLDRVQVFYAKQGEDWKTARLATKSQQHVLLPISIKLLLQKSMIDHDHTLPKFKISGDLPLLSLSLSDVRLQEIIQLVRSIPLPEAGDEEELEAEDMDIFSDVPYISRNVNGKHLLECADLVNLGEQEHSNDSSCLQVTVCRPLMEMEFEIKEVSISLQEHTRQREIPMISLVLQRLGAVITSRKFDTKAVAYLGGIYLKHRTFKASKSLNQQLSLTSNSAAWNFDQEIYSRSGSVMEEGLLINMINSLTDEETHLLTCVFHKADPRGPEFESIFEKTEQKLDIKFTSLEVLIHQEALLSVIKFAIELHQSLQVDKSTIRQARSSQVARKDNGSRQKSPNDKQKCKKKRKKKDGTIVMRVSADLEGFGLILCTNTRVITTGRINGITGAVVIQDSKTVVTSELREITMYDSNTETKYPKIVEIKDEAVLKLNLTIYNGVREGDKYSDMSCVDASVDVQLGCIRGVFLRCFVNDLNKYIASFQVKELESQIQAAKIKVREASGAVTESAKEALTQFVKKSPRVAINMSISSPVILIPERSDSLKALMLDFGRLNIKNSFSTVPTTAISPVVLDSIMIELKSMKMARVQLDRENEVSGHCLIVEPTSMSLSITRNLAFEWFKEIPAFDISGQLESIEANISEGDCRLITTWIHDNLSEDRTSKRVPELAEGSNIKAGSVTISSTSRKQSDVYTKLQFTFNFKCLSSTLYSGESKLTRDGNNSRSIDQDLGQIRIRDVMVKSEVKNDGSKTINVLVRDAIVDDKRKKIQQTGVKRIMERCKMFTREQEYNILDIQLIQDTTKNKYLNMKVCSMRIVFCLDFLMPLADFFRNGVPKFIPAATEFRSTDSEGHMSIAVIIEEPEIILIEDQLNEASNSLLLCFGMEFKVQINRKEQDVSARVKRLRIASAIFNERNKYRTQILPACDIELSIKALFWKWNHIHVLTSDIVLKISPQTIRTIALISLRLSKTQKEEIGNKKPKWKVPADLWKKKKISKQKIWFLKDVSNEESQPQRTRETKIEHGKKQVVVNVPNIVIKLEGGVGKRTMPLLITELSLDAIADISSSVERNVNFDIRLDVAFYNEKLSVWEYLVEPLMENGEVRKWYLGIQIIKKDDCQSESPKMSINLNSSDPMEMTITNTCLEVLNNLAKAFGDAYKLVPPTEVADGISSPYVIKNTTGMPVLLELDSSFEAPPEMENGTITLVTNKTLPLYERKHENLKRQASVIDFAQKIDEKRITFQIVEFGAMREVIIKRSEKRLYPVYHMTDPEDTWSVVCCTETSIGQKTLHLRSIVQMKNNLPYAVKVFSNGNSTKKLCGLIRPDELFDVPLTEVYNESGQFFLKPEVTGCEVSNTSFSLKNVEKCLKMYISCKNKNGSNYSICVKTEVNHIYFNETGKLSAKTYLFQLSPSIVFHNLLDIPLRLLSEGLSSKIKYGEGIPLTMAMPGKSKIEVKIKNYGDRDWHGSHSISTECPELFSWTLKPVLKGPKTLSLNLGLHCEENEGCLDMSMYSPYWMINKTGMTLYYTGNDSDNVIEHSPGKKGVVFFSFKPKTFRFRKKKAFLRVADSDWSKEFSLDTVGCSGTIQCKSTSRLYEFGVKIRLSSSGLTKICTFTPLYMLLNTSEVTLLCAETTTQDNWIQIPSKSCLPFWPVQSGKIRTMTAKVEGSSYITGPFYFSKPHTSLLKADDQVGGIHIDCQVTEAAIVTTLTTYKPGMATVLLINNTNKTSIKYKQSGETIAHYLAPVESVLYTWENAIGKRELEWGPVRGKPKKTSLIKDETDTCIDLNLCTTILGVSFLDGLQRVLLFTESYDKTTLIAREFEEKGRFDTEIDVSLHSIGVSLVNDTTQTEVAYLSITSSTNWEEEKSIGKYQPINVNTAELLETAYQRFLRGSGEDERLPNALTLDKSTEVNLRDMRMIRPNNRKIQRSFQEGFWIQYRLSPHTRQVHAKINRIQVDNQNNRHVYQTILAQVTPTKSMAEVNVHRPFVEVSIFAVKHDYSYILQFKYCKVLIQEMSLKIDQGFLDIIDLITPSQHTSVKKRLKALQKKLKEPFDVVQKELKALQRNKDCIYERETDNTKAPRPQSEKKAMIEADLKMVYRELLEETGQAKEQKHFFENLHFSPLKINFSLSLQHGVGGDRETVHFHTNSFINGLLQCNDAQDVVFRLEYFERNNCFFNISQLVSQVRRHYQTQGRKQLYVLVLGLDVLGNPFGLLRGIAEGGFDLFYEPIKGSIQGPQEFAEGLSIGVKSLLGRTVGGTAGAVSRIGGSIGKGLAFLTFDDEYQKKRQEGLNKKPANIGEGFARGGKDLFMGFFHGATGIVRQPIRGAQREGVEGFFKGIGRGLVGVLTRPTSGIVDFASGSFEGIKRIAELSDEAERIRLPRRFYSDRIIRPYNLIEATGYAILQETEEGKFAGTDEYMTHCVVSGDSNSTKSVVLVTDRRVIYAKKGIILGHWEEEWSHIWSDLKEKPRLRENKVEFLLKEKRKFPFFIGSSIKEIYIPDFEIAKWLISEISKAMERM